MLPVIEWTVDGRPVWVDEDWICNAVANGGFDQARITISEKDARRLGVEQGIPVTAYRTSGDILWTGEAAADPVLRSGYASLAASGPKTAIEKAFGRRLFQSMNLEDFASMFASPHEYTINEQIQASIGGGEIVFSIAGGSQTAGGERNGFVFWARGATITRFAFTYRQPSVTMFDVQTYGATGPNGTLTGLTTHSGVNSIVDVDETIATVGDLLVIAGLWDSSTDPVNSHSLHLRRMRVNGIAPGDVFNASQVVDHIGTLLGFDVTGVEANLLNVLPLDWKVEQGSWAGLLDYISVLTDWSWGAYDRLEFAPWDKTWEVSRAYDAIPELTPLERFDKAVVAFRNAAGIADEIIVEGEPLKRGSRTISYTLQDTQTSDELPLAVGSALLSMVGPQRHQGSVPIIDARDEAGRGDIYGVRPGTEIRIVDMGPLSAVAHRVAEVTYRSDGATCGINVTDSIAGLLAHWNLAAQRAFTPFAPVSKRRRRRRAGGGGGDGATSGGRGKRGRPTAPGGGAPV